MIKWMMLLTIIVLAGCSDDPRYGPKPGVNPWCSDPHHPGRLVLCKDVE